MASTIVREEDAVLFKSEKDVGVCNIEPNASPNSSAEDAIFKTIFVVAALIKIITNEITVQI